MEKLKYVSPAYQEQLHKLAETLCSPERYVGQLALNLDNVVELFPVAEPSPPEAA